MTIIVSIYYNYFGSRKEEVKHCRFSNLHYDLLDANCQKTPYVHADIQQIHQSISYYVVPLIIALEIKPLVNQTRTKEISIDSYLETTSYIWKLMRLFLLQSTIFCVTPTAGKSVKVQISEFVHDTSTCFNPLPLCVSLSNQYL